MNKLFKDLVFIKLKDKETGRISKPVGIRKLIFEQDEIEFEWGKFGDDDYASLPYKDFLFFKEEYDVIIMLKEE